MFYLYGNPLHKLLLSILTLFISVTVYGCNDLKLDNGVIISPSTCVAFVTDETYNGDLGSLSGADNKCNQSATANTFLKTHYVDKNISFKALLGWNHATVLGKNYYRAFDTEAGPAGTVLIATAAGPNLSRNLTNSIINPAAIGAFSVWTGMANGISFTGNNDNCNNWNDTRYYNKGPTGIKHWHSYHASYGQPDQSGYNWNKGDRAECKDQRHLICIAQ